MNKNFENISVLGCGRWGSFIAWYLATQKNKKVYLWGPEEDYSYKVLKETGKNDYTILDKKINLTADLHEAITHAQVIIISISAQGLRGFIERILATADVQNKIFILCMKGIETNTGSRLSSLLIDAGIAQNSIAVWVGPGHIQDFTKGIPNCMVIDSYDAELRKNLADDFKSNLIRFYYGNDIIGTEIGAAAKNVIGIAAGVLDGIGQSSMKGPLMSRGAIEVARLIQALGGNPLSAYGLAHLGDYEATVFSKHSHNRKYGEAIAQGTNFEKLAEGVATAKAMYILGQKLNVDLPITNAVYTLCNLAKEGKVNQENAIDLVMKLFEREPKVEF